MHSKINPGVKLHMEDKILVKLLKRSEEKALEDIIKKYTGYVSTVIANQLGKFGKTDVIEELASDVFFNLWQNRLQVFSYHLRGWLGTAARNKAKSYLRALDIHFDNLEEDSILCSEDNLFDSLEKREQEEIIKKALSKIRPEEREIIIRYYYYNQTVSKIAEEIKLNQETAKSRLKRGRIKLKDILEKGGYFS